MNTTKLQFVNEYGDLSSLDHQSYTFLRDVVARAMFSLIYSILFIACKFAFLSCVQRVFPFGYFQILHAFELLMCFLFCFFFFFGENFFFFSTQFTEITHFVFMNISCKLISVMDKEITFLNLIEINSHTGNFFLFFWREIKAFSIDISCLN